MPRPSRALAVADKDRVLGRLCVRAERRGRRGVADGIVARRIVIGGEQQIIQAVPLERAGPLIPDHAAALQLPRRCRRRQQHRLADRAAEIGGKLHAAGLADALIPPVILAVVAGIEQIDAAVVVKQQARVDDAVAGGKKRMIVHIDKGACRMLRLRKADAVAQLVHRDALGRLVRRRIHHVIRAAVCIDLGRPVAGRAEGLLGHPVSVAERRPAAEVFGRPTGVMPSAGAVHVIFLLGLVIKDERVADARDLPVRAGEAVRVGRCGVRDFGQFLHRGLLDGWFIHPV